MPSTPASPTRPSPNDLQSHLYASFLQRKTADVALRISGTWHAVYRLHRVILIQAGFFQSLFTSGFSESKAKHSGHRADAEYIDIVFDDLNITRAVCIARLYGGGPPLWISPSMIPTPTCPLTPPFASGGPDYTPQQPGGAFPSSLDISSSPDLPPGHHPATPRFLLSLLATATFLSIPSVASQALSAILRTVGPHTVVRYLNFAIGRGIGPPGDIGVESDEYEREDGPAIGLEQVAELIKEEDASFDSSVDVTPRDTTPVGSGSPSVKEEPKHSRICGSQDTDSDTDSEYHGDDDENPKSESMEPCYYYGAVSDKVGEAAACWLTRWGIDMLRYEEQAMASEAGAVSKAGPSSWVPAAHYVSLNSERPGSAPPEMRGSRMGASSYSRLGRAEVAVPVIWRRGGLSARWVRGILSSDALFVRGEKERYEVVRSVVEMRRAARTKGVPGESEEVEEAEFERLFREGIYYANLNLDDLMAISGDVSPSTGKPFVPLPVLQSAHWNQSALYHRITSRPAGSSSPTLSPAGSAAKELGLGVPPAEIPKHTVHPEEQDKAFFPIPGDSSLRLGDSTGLEGASMEQLFDMGSAKKGVNSTEANFFGLEQARRPASAFAASSSEGVNGNSSASANVGGTTAAVTQWTAHPPFRFAVEFWDVDALKEKSRLHSHTIWYAGSLYNVYVQVVRKKGVQLGIYLHRQSTVDPIPASSAPAVGVLPSPPPRTVGRGPSASVSSPRPASLVGSGSAGTHSPTPMSPLARTSTTVSMPNSPASASSSPLSSSLPNGNGFARSSANLHGSSHSIGASPSMPLSLPVTLPAMAAAAAPPQPYRDPRPAVSAYFTIACASATGASLTRFTSAPDVFSRLRFPLLASSTSSLRASTRWRNSTFSRYPPPRRFASSSSLTAEPAAAAPSTCARQSIADLSSVLSFFAGCF
ncbi:hypothetical protein GY45DRAFT_1347855 [Cubamyces sp. BRFM 1775]|nr:hypothetical protein GY45DRAFT_1347855 [Cubamyces sp. BRFM 1775]